MIFPYKENSYKEFKLGKWFIRLYPPIELIGEVVNLGRSIHTYELMSIEKWPGAFLISFNFLNWGLYGYDIDKTNRIKELRLGILGIGKVKPITTLSRLKSRMKKYPKVRMKKVRS